MKTDILNKNIQTMTSLEIAKLTGKQPMHVNRDISNLLKALGLDASKFGCIYLDSMNRKQKQFELPRRG